jgi:predicted DsbA family dithiol-disulfide isomerase
MHDKIFENQEALELSDIVGYAQSLGLDITKFQADLEAGTFAKKVRDDFRSGVKSGVNGTPTFFINGSRYDGSWANVEAFTSALRAAAHNGVEAPA